MNVSSLTKLQYELWWTLQFEQKNVLLVDDHLDGGLVQGYCFRLISNSLGLDLAVLNQVRLRCSHMNLSTHST